MEGCLSKALFISFRKKSIFLFPHLFPLEAEMYSIKTYGIMQLIERYVGESPSGKAGAFEASIPWFESMLPSHIDQNLK